MCVFVLYRFSTNQISNIVTPINRLIKKTQAILNIDDNSKTSTHGKDELDELEQSLSLIDSNFSKQIQTVSTMEKIDELILSSIDMQKIVHTVIVHIQKTIHCDFISIFIMQDSSKQQGTLYSNNHPNIDKKDISLNHSLVEKLLQNTTSFELSQNNSMHFNFTKNTASPHTSIVLPIILNNSLSAFISLDYFKTSTCSKEELKSARGLADRVAVAITNAAWKNKLYHHAHYDLLTNLPNRLLFKKRISDAISNAIPNNKHIALLYIDTNRFKSINDSLGHGAGDQYLIVTADRIQKCLSSVDTIARIGGDEFIVILPNLDSNLDAIDIASNVASKISHSTSMACEIDNHQIVLTHSIGISIFPTDADNYSDLIKAADAALYYTKSQKNSNCWRRKYWF